MNNRLLAASWVPVERNGRRAMEMRWATPAPVVALAPAPAAAEDRRAA